MIAAPMDLFYKFPLNAARRLPNVPAGHICGRVHGHTFAIEIWLRGEVGETTGWVVDFADLDTPVGAMRELLEHNYLNDIDGLENPTSENLAIWIWRRLELDVAGLYKIVVAEGADRGCCYYGP